MSKFPLYEKMCDYKLMKHGYKQALKGKKKYRTAAILFDMAREKNLVELWRSLQKETYCPGSYTSQIVYRPKLRRVSAPRFRDKIIQFMVHLIIWEIYEAVFIKDSFACMEERGEHKAAARVQHYMRQCQWQHGDCWIIKGDIKKYFYSISRDILKKLYRKKIKDEKFLRLLDMIVDSSPEGESGIPLGNVSSQDFANIYLNELDQFVKRYLGVKYYVRYMDDFIAVVPTKEDAEKILGEIERFLRERLNIECNAKTHIFPIAQGVNAYGYKIHPAYMHIRESSKRSMKRRIRKMDEKQKAGLMTQKEVKQSVNAWLGHARHSNSFNLATKIFKPYPYITVEHPKYRFGKKAPV